VKWGHVVLGALAVATVGGGVYLAPEGYHRLAEHFEWGQTTGEIYVSGPQVYTRERLVNDRYREDAWLLAMLEASTKQVYGPVASQTRSGRSEWTVGAQIHAGAAAAGSAPVGDEAGTPTANADPSGGRGGGEANPPAALAGVDQFDLQRQYREHVRKLMIENQLDDRHDLRGNSLYRLGFDVAVLPGQDTRKSAKISVSILPPEGLLPEVDESTKNNLLRQKEEELTKLFNLSELKGIPTVWEKVYLRWLESLGKRFDDARRTLRASYDGNRFSPEQYDRLLDAIVNEARGWAHLVRDLQASASARGKSVADAIPQTPDHWTTKSLTELAGAIAARPDVTDLDQFRADYSSELQEFYRRYRDGQVEVEDKGHQVYKTEIERLVDLTSGLKALHKDLREAVNVEPFNVGFAPAAVLGNPNECQALKDYVNSSAKLAAVPLVDPLLTRQNASATPDITYFLDVTFEGSLAQSVLGLLPGPAAPQDRGQEEAKLVQLSPLAIVSVNYGAPNRAFSFSPRTAGFTVVGNPECLPSDRDKYALSATVGNKTIYALSNEISILQSIVPGYNWVDDVKKRYPTGEIPHNLQTISVDVGLINFIRAAGHRLDAFSYAFTPTEPTEFTATRSSLARSQGFAVNATVGATESQSGGGGAKVGHQEQVESGKNVAREPIISFGDQENSASPTFGWYVQPDAQIDETGAFRQRPSQISLAALVSLPAWWEEMRLKVKREWVDESGKPEGAEAPVTFPPEEYTIELPVNFEAVDASVFETMDRNPVIFEGTGDSVTVKPCSRADIVIHGRRLWRSTVVTLGGQKADEIFVLPDMNGIIASFTKVRFPNGWSDATATNANHRHHEPLTVWTSQGSATLPAPVTFEATDVKGPECPLPLSPRDERRTGLEGGFWFALPATAP
jgi:hypothetical protein